jgi:hypothetical protein
MRLLQPSNILPPVVKLGKPADKPLESEDSNVMRLVQPENIVSPIVKLDKSAVNV